jgi:hypothetical protein
MALTLEWEAMMGDRESWTACIIHDDAETIHLRHHFPAEVTQAAVLLLGISQTLAGS